MAELEEFDTWLYDRLRDLQTDENVFGPYIKSIVEGDEDTEEKIEALDGLLIELQTNSNVENLRDEILERWNKAQSAIASASKKLPNVSLAGISINSAGGDGDKRSFLEQVNSSGSGQLKSDSNDKLGETLGGQMDAFLRLSGLDSQANNSSSDNKASSSSSRRPQSDLGADSALRAAILSQYCANESSSEDEDGVTKPKSKSGGLEGLEKNDNAEKVLAEQREIKEKSRAEHAKKKDRDKDDRAKQKQAAQDRKEKAKKKATKCERKR